MVHLIEFKGKEYYLVMGRSLVTEEQLRELSGGYAVIEADGFIYRCQERIGMIEEILFKKEIDIEDLDINPDAIVRIGKAIVASFNRAVSSHLN